MRGLGLGVLASVFVSAATAQAPSPSASGDFDGDGKSDAVRWVSQSGGKCALQVHLAARPGAMTLIESGGSADCPEAGAEIEVRPGGSYKVKDFRGERTMIFAHDVILSARRPGVRSVKYWNGTGFAGTWIPD